MKIYLSINDAHGRGNNELECEGVSALCGPEGAHPQGMCDCCLLAGDRRCWSWQYWKAVKS